MISKYIDLTVGAGLAPLAKGGMSRSDRGDFICPDYTKLEEPAKAIREGKLVLFPTETVYGIGANALDSEAVKRIFAAKGRKQDNPLIVHISNMNMLTDLVEKPNEIEQKLMDKFWPGPLTIVFKKKKIIPDVVTAGLDTVGIRMPENIISRKLIEYSGVAIAAPSANISGRPSGTKISDIINELNGKVEYIIDSGMAEIGVESTVVRVLGNAVHILRPGKITKEDFEKLGLKVNVDKHVLGKYENQEKVMSPGMKYRHYAPKTKCLLVYSKNEANLINEINKIAENNKNTAVIAKTRNLDKYNAEYILDMGDTLEEISRNIFTILRKVDDYKADLVVIEGAPQTGLGLAIMNRLIRACDNNYIEC
ncbi:MAG: L-threonylcarbamoyladenylate synthase [Firmicutes bacterium]|nr:L-threonylcarbamoyladenylate synthase [Bacillota bacterium]